MDFTVMHGSGAVWRSEGIAADGIADVALRTTAGDLIDVTPVANNVYSLSGLPSGRVDALVARDAGGRVLWSEPLR